MTSKIRKILNQTLNVLAGASFIVMVLLTCWQVFTRYILNNPSSWSEELVGYMFGWMSLFGAALVSGERGHMNIPILIDKLNDTGKKVMALFSEAIALVFSISILIYGGAQITSLAMGQLTSSLGVAVGVFYVVMPIAGVLIAVYTILNVIDICTGKISLDSVDEAAQAVAKAEEEV